MAQYVIRRVLLALLVVLIVSILIFLAMRLLPGDPIAIYMTQHGLDLIDEQFENQLRIEFGLDKPLIVQYVRWIADVFQGDFGNSIYYRESVGMLLSQRIPVTLHLGLVSFIISTILGVLFGIIAALRRGRWIDSVVTSLSNLGVSAPNFWFGVLLIYVFGLYLNWLPIQGYTSPTENFVLSTRQMIMPVIVLSTFNIAFLCRQTRSAMLDVVYQDYIRTAWSKGLSERIIVARHVLRNGLIPVITIMGMSLSHLIGGAMIIENVFNIPGMGRLMVAAVFGKDYQIVQAVVLIIAVCVVFINLAIDVAYGWIDPRIRFD
jgi:peptide/nickel transport system permease protein